MAFRNVCQSLLKYLPSKQEMSSGLDGDFIEFQSFEKLNPLLHDYGPVMRVNLEGISSGESSPCHSDNENPSTRSKRKKDLTLYDAHTDYLDSSTVEELTLCIQDPKNYDWVILMGFTSDQQVAKAKKLLAQTQAKAKVRYAKRVYYKGFRSCLLECMSHEDAKYTLDLALKNFASNKKLRASIWGMQVRSRFNDPDFLSSYNAVIVKDIPPQFTKEIFMQILQAESYSIVPKAIDVFTFIENTIVTVINFFSLEDAEIMCQKLNNKKLQHNYILKAALISKPQFSHQNKDNSIFKEYLIEPQKAMIQKIINSRLFKNEHENIVSETKKNNIKELINFLSKKKTPPIQELQAKNTTQARLLENKPEPVEEEKKQITVAEPSFRVPSRPEIESELQNNIKNPTKKEIFKKEDVTNAQASENANDNPPQVFPESETKGNAQPSVAKKPKRKNKKKKKNKKKVDAEKRPKIPNFCANQPPQRPQEPPIQGYAYPYYGGSFPMMPGHPYYGYPHPFGTMPPWYMYPGTCFPHHPPAPLYNPMIAQPLSQIPAGRYDQPENSVIQKKVFIEAAQTVTSARKIDSEDVKRL